MFVVVKTVETPNHAKSDLQKEPAVHDRQRRKHSHLHSERVLQWKFSGNIKYRAWARETTKEDHEATEFGVQKYCKFLKVRKYKHPLVYDADIDKILPISFQAHVVATWRELLEDNEIADEA